MMKKNSKGGYDFESQYEMYQYCVNSYKSLVNVFTSYKYKNK